MSVDLDPNQDYARLDDLGFRTCNNFSLLHLELSLQTLARLHSSYLLDTNLNGFQERDECCYEEKIVEEGSQRLREILAITPGRPWLQVLVEEVRESRKRQEGVLNVLCHGDLRAGNILFRFVTFGAKER